MRKALYYVIAIGLAFSITACGKGTASVSDSGNSGREEAESSESDKDDEDEDERREEKEEKDDSSESSSPDEESGISDRDNEDEEGGASESPDIDLGGLTSKHGRAYVYTWIGTESLYDGVWEFTECDGYIYDEGTEMERTLTVYRYSDTSAIEYMLEFAGEWGEYWHVNYDYPADCTYFDCVEGGTVTISGNTATWEADWGEYREIYSLKETHEFDD